RAELRCLENRCSMRLLKNRNSITLTARKLQLSATSSGSRGQAFSSQRTIPMSLATTNDNPLLETGEQLYRAMQARGLQLRTHPQEDRDNALYVELCRHLKCREGDLMHFLREQKTSAEEFLRAREEALNLRLSIRGSVQA